MMLTGIHRLEQLIGEGRYGNHAGITLGSQGRGIDYTWDGRRLSSLTVMELESAIREAEAIPPLVVSQGR